MPIAATINPNCLVVEYATTFLISYWLSATLAAKMAVVEPKILIRGSAQDSASINSKVRIKRKTPATTIVDLWSKAETGVGPSIADGSHGCKINWADLPPAASINPITPSFIIEDGALRWSISWRFQEL